MSKKHPIIAVTGSSGSGRGTVREAFRKACKRDGLKPFFIEGEGFHKFTRVEMADMVQNCDKRRECPNLSHFGPDANLFKELEALYKSYGDSGGGMHRRYLHDEHDVAEFGDANLKPGEFTPWEKVPEGTDLLIYEGLHGAVKTDDVDLAPYVDLRVGVAPIINLEWIQKIRRDTRKRGYTEEAVMDTILRRMHDYVHYIIPQFKSSDVNFQRVPVVDTSNPMIAQDTPKDDECVVVIRFRRPTDFNVDFPHLLNRIHDSWMSRRNTIVVPGGKMGLAMELILAPILLQITQRPDES